MAQPINSTEKRLRWIERREAEFAKRIRAFQRDLWERLDKIVLSSIAVDSGSVKTTAGNYTVLGRLRGLERELKKGPRRSLIKWALDGLLEQSDQVRDYFREILDKRHPTTEERVHKALLNRVGYDGEGFVSRGVLYDLWQDNAEIRAIKAQTVKAIAAGQNWQSFYTSMKDLVLGNEDRQGLTEAQFRQVTYDMFSQNDRALTKHYADDIGLDKFIYQGGLMDNTREFCLLRNNRIFTRKEIKSWEKLEFQGKPPVYDPFLDCGGYNCRHVLDPISDELAQEYENEGEKIDEFNEIVQETDDSSRLPEDKINAIKKKVAKYNPDMDNDFVSLMHPDTKVSVRTNNRSNHYNPESDTINLFLKQRMERSEYYRQAIPYHEFAHSMHHKKGLITVNDINPQLKKEIDVLGRKYRKELIDVDNRLKSIGQRLMFADEKVFDRYGISGDDFGEALMTTRDVIGSFTKGDYGAGHPISYYRSGYKSYMEVLAHAASFKYVENKFMTKYLPALQKDLIKLIDKYYFDAGN